MGRILGPFPSLSGCDARPAPAPDPDLLLALNAADDLARETVCRLGADPARWASTDASPKALGLNVSAAQLRRAREIARRPGGTARGQRRRARELGASIVLRGDPAYPAGLADLELPPPVLYLLGRIPRRPAVAIVGSRQADPYGLETAERFGAALAGHGLTVVSGFARGVDAAAHRGAVGAPGGRTIAVLGCGLERDYPRGSRRLAAQIAAAGALITEFPPEARPRPANFPIRNRIIAALAVGTLVVRATPRSGSLITARLALELGRDVYAVPGSIYDERSVGANQLIRDGALLAQEPRDIVESLPLDVQARLAPAPASGSTPDSAADPLLARLPRGEPLDANEIARRTGLEMPRLLARLAELELAGQVRRYPGPRFCRRR